jgi:flotillin
MSYVVIGAGALVLSMLLFKLMWRVAEPNEALIISGLKTDAPLGDDGPEASLGFKIVTGKGTLVIPGVQTVRKMSLDLREAELEIDCVTHQGIPLGVKGVVIFKVGDDFHSIANSARRFLDQQDLMDQRVHNVFAGHLRAIVGNMTVEEMIRDREKLTALTRQSSGIEMEKLGLIVDSLQIQEIVDPTGYIANLARPQAATVESNARIASAEADRAATQAEAEAEARKAEAIRESAILQAGYQAEVDQAEAQALQAGPLADARARQQVVAEATKVAKLEAEQAEQRLFVEVRKPADARAYEQRALAEAARDATLAAAAAEAEHARVVGLAEAEAIEAKGLAEAAALAARAEALAENQDAVIGQELAERWPEIVEAAAKPFGNIDNLTVLNGASGLSEALASALAQGVAGLSLARQLLAAGTTPESEAAAPAAAARVVKKATASNGAR